MALWAAGWFSQGLQPLEMMGPRWNSPPLLIEALAEGSRDPLDPLLLGWIQSWIQAPHQGGSQQASPSWTLKGEGKNGCNPTDDMK